MIRLIKKKIDISAYDNTNTAGSLVGNKRGTYNLINKIPFLLFMLDFSS